MCAGEDSSPIQFKNATAPSTKTEPHQETGWVTIDNLENTTKWLTTKFCRAKKVHIRSAPRKNRGEDLPQPEVLLYTFWGCARSSGTTPPNTGGQPHHGPNHCQIDSEKEEKFVTKDRLQALQLLLEVADNLMLPKGQSKPI